MRRTFPECGMHYKIKTYCGCLSYLISGNRTELLFLAKIDCIMEFHGCINSLQFRPSYKTSFIIFIIAENSTTAGRYTKETSLTTCKCNNHPYKLEKNLNHYHHPNCNRELLKWKMKQHIRVCKPDNGKFMVVFTL